MGYKIAIEIPREHTSRTWNTELGQIAEDLGADTYTADSKVITTDDVYIANNVYATLTNMGLFVNPIKFESL
jgi:hypothetical protein